MHAALLGTIDWPSLAGIVGSLATVAGVVGGLDFRRRKRVAGAQQAASRVRDVADDGEALDIARESAGGDKASVVLAVLDRQQAAWMRRNVDCEVRLAEEKRERKAEAEGLRDEVAELRAKVEELSRERQ